MNDLMNNENPAERQKDKKKDNFKINPNFLRKKNKDAEGKQRRK